MKRRCPTHTDGTEQAGLHLGVEATEMVAYHLMPRGMPDNKTHLQLAALDQVIAKLFQEGQVNPRAFEGLVFPDKEVQAPEPAPPFSEFSSTTLGVFPEGSSAQHSHYAAALNFSSFFSPAPTSLNSASTFPFSVPLQ